MLPGPTIYYKCTRCGKITKGQSLRSGNTFGSILYSDGKRVSPMLPEYPAIIKCKNCNIFYWLDNENEIDSEGPEAYWLSDENKIKSKYPEAYSAEFLSVAEYHETIISKIYRNEDELKFLRIRLWWSFNDRIRKRENIFLAEKDQEMYEQNCLELINILNKKDINEKIMIAELFRNLGNYSESCKVMETLGKKYVWIKEQLTNECNKNNKYLIALKE